jgi:hemolysin activation/secretion protein
MTMIPNPRRLTLLAAASLMPFCAQAQTASQLTQPDYAPSTVSPVRQGLTLPATTGLDAPAGAEKLEVTPSGLIVTGGLDSMSSETAAIEARLKNRRVSAADLFAAARDLEAAYVRAGYVLVRVSLPPQTILDGKPLRLTVTEGYVEAIDVSALPSRVQSIVQRTLAPLTGRKNVTLQELERRLLLAGDTAGLLLKSALQAGSQTGATVIVVDGRHDPVNVSLFMDNSLDADLGRYSAGAAVDLNSLLGFGEVFYLRLMGYPGLDGDFFSDDPRNRQIAGGVTVPLGTNGVWFGLEGVDSRTHPRSRTGFAILDHFQRGSVRLGYKWVRSRSFNTASQLSFDMAAEEQTLTLGSSGFDWAEDQTRVLRFNQTADLYTSWGAVISGGVTASLGLDALGARSATTSLPMTRFGARPDFGKLDMSAQYNQSFFNQRMHFQASGKAQTSFGDPLAASEQIGLSGTDWISGYGAGKIEGDAGAAIRAELSVPVSLQLPGGFTAAASPYVFGAAGLAKLEAPTALEEDETRASAFGVGIRAGLSEAISPRSATIALEYAHGSATGMEDADRFNLRVMTRF